MYQPFNYPRVEDSISFATNLRWLKIPQPVMPNSPDDGTTEPSDASKGSALRSLQIGRYSTVFQKGNSASLILKEAPSLPKVFRLQRRSVTSLAAFNSVGCETGFAATGSGSLSLCNLSSSFNYGQIGWAARKIPLYEDIGALSYHSQRKVYVAATTKTTDFGLPEDGHHQEWARESRLHLQKSAKPP
jgi:cleavage and polyadenylation specificity factor subunit 1